MCCGGTLVQPKQKVRLFVCCVRARALSLPLVLFSPRLCEGNEAYGPETRRRRQQQRRENLTAQRVREVNRREEKKRVLRLSAARGRLKPRRRYPNPISSYYISLPCLVMLPPPFLSLSRSAAGAPCKVFLLGNFYPAGVEVVGRSLLLLSLSVSTAFCSPPSDVALRRDIPLLLLLLLAPS